jgi:transketolase
LFDVDGPCYIRFAREATPVVTTDATPLTFGKANVVRYRGARSRFADAFEFILADQYRSEAEAAAIVSNGPELAEAMRAAWILKEELGLETRVVNLHTLKPLDERTLVAAARDCGAVLTVEEHQVGGLGNLVAGAILRANVGREIVFDSMGIPDRFGTSGGSWELLRAFGLTGEHIAARVRNLVEQRNAAT